jgi:hypothetical protein
MVAKYGQVVVLTDSSSHISWEHCRQLYGINNKTYLLSRKIDLGCERVKKSYFFILSKENKPLHIYFPRREVPQVTEKYLDDNLKRARFF